MSSKFLLIDFDQNQARINDFSLSINKLFNKEVISIPLLNIKNDVKYFSKCFSLAALTLENFILNDSTYWSYRKDYLSVFYLFGNYSENYLSKLRLFENYVSKNLIIFPSVKGENLEEEWIFGNIIGMIKWSSSLFKIDNSMLKDIYNNGNSSGGYYKEFDEYKYRLWFASRIGMDVKLLNDLDSYTEL